MKKLLVLAALLGGACADDETPHNEPPCDFPADAACSAAFDIADQRCSFQEACMGADVSAHDMCVVDEMEAICAAGNCNNDNYDRTILDMCLADAYRVECSMAAHDGCSL